MLARSAPALWPAARFRSIARPWRATWVFSRITANSLDAVSDRDFALEYLFALSGIATHLSRLSEDMVLFASQEFALRHLPDEYSTGSSLMPQKKNPDAWELIRGKTGRIYGALVALLTTMQRACHRVISATCRKTKNRSSRRTIRCWRLIRIAAAALAATRFREERLREAAQDPGLVATELADYSRRFWKSRSAMRMK